MIIPVKMMNIFLLISILFVMFITVVIVILIITMSINVVLCRRFYHPPHHHPAPPNYPLRDPKYHLIETIRPFIEVHWGPGSRGIWPGAGLPGPGVLLAAWPPLAIGVQPGPIQHRHIDLIYMCIHTYSYM